MNETKDKRRAAWMVRVDPELDERVKQVADTDPEFEGISARVVRKAVRDFLDRRTAEINADEAVAA